MINLLPVEEKKKIAADYRVRIATFYLYSAGIILVIASVALLPSYFLASLKERLTSGKWESLKNLPVPEPDKETVQGIKDVNAKTSLIQNSEKSKFPVLESAFDEVIYQKMPDIKLTAIDYEKDKDGVKKISLRGLAPDRERLLLFRQALEADKIFSKVDLPISNFVKGENIDFSLNLIAS
jgi:hypothetical protein